MKRIATISSFAAALAVMTGSAQAAPLEIKIQWSVAPAHITPLLPHAPKGIYKHYGKSYVIKPQRMRGSGPALQAVAAGEISFGGMSAQALVRGVKKAKLDLVGIANVMSSNVKGYGSTGFFSLAGKFKSLKELKGKVVAVNAIGSSIDAAVIAQFGKVGMKAGRDFQVVEVRFPAMLGALQKGRVQLTPLLTGFELRAKSKGVKIDKLFDMRDALGPTETLVWIGRRDFVKKNRAALVDFLEDNIRFRKWAFDPKNREAVLNLLAKVTKRPAKGYAPWAFTKKDSYRHPLALVDVKRYQKNVDDLIKLGVLKTKLDVSKHVDNSLAEEAAKRIK